jgi:hypothetical protein
MADHRYLANSRTWFPRAARRSKAAIKRQVFNNMQIPPSNGLCAKSFRNAQRITDRLQRRGLFGSVLADLASGTRSGAGPDQGAGHAVLKVAMADSGYGADHLRQAIAAKGVLASFPTSTPTRRMLLLEAQAVQERCNALRKKARNYQAGATLATIILWMR